MAIHQLRLSVPRQRRSLAILCALLAVAGGYLVIRAHAAGSFASLQPESGTLAGSATAVTNAAASGGHAVKFGPGASPTPSPTPPPGMRTLPDPLYGVTVDNIASVTNIVNSSTHLAHMPTTRIVFDTAEPASYYTSAVNTIQPVSYIMGELLDSSDLSNVTTQQYHDRTASYLQALGSKVDLWEVGNEVNGNWTGAYADVSAKISDAFNQVHAAGKRSELTLWYDAGCGNGPSELDPINFTNQYVPAAMRSGLDYVTISYYETQCSNIRPTAATFTTFFNQLHALYPNAKLGFGEIGFPGCTAPTATAQSMISYYYGLHITSPGYVGGYFWWCYYEDMLPYTTKTLWQNLNQAFQAY